MSHPEKAMSAREELKALQTAEKEVSKIRPFLQSEGSSISVKDYKDGCLTILVSGACVGCSLSGADFGDLEQLLLSEIEGIKQVCFVNPNGLPLF